MCACLGMESRTEDFGKYLGVPTINGQYFKKRILSPSGQDE